jgi:hypothetical protein
MKRRERRRRCQIAYLNRDGRKGLSKLPMELWRCGGLG